MAWYKRYRVPFQSLGGDQYVVYIYEKTNGNVVTLTGAAEPFVTQEDDSDNIFEPIRKQTGYLRVIDETQDGSLLESLIPSNNTEKLVRLYFGEYENGTFNDANLLWSGFLCAEAYTQPWDNQVKELEFPVKSILAALDDVFIPETSASSQSKVAKLFVDAFNALGETPRTVYVISNLNNIETTLLTSIIENRIFFDIEEEQNEGDSVKKLVGMSYYQALSDIVRLFGVSIRMHNNILYIAMYDNAAGKIGLLQFASWSNFVDLANGSAYGGSTFGVTEVSILSETFAGIDNVAGFVQGANEAIVRLEIKESDLNLIELPITTEDTSTVYEVSNIMTGQVFVQPHSPRSNSIESFNFFEYQASGQNYNKIGTSNYNNCLANCVIFRPLYDPLYSENDHLHTGAFPCRWYYKKDANSQPSLKNGMFLNQMYMKDGSYTPDYCYRIESQLSHTLRDGYLHINMKCLNFMRGILAADSDKLYFGEFTSIWGSSKTTRLFCILTCGNYEWNGTYWQVHSGNYNTFEIEFYGENIKTNKTAEMSVDETEGYFIPIGIPGLAGKVRLYITNVSECVELNSQGQVINTYDNHSKIITDLSIDFLPTINPMASRRTSNTYRQQILSSGFSGNEAIDLNIGTYNNNIPSDSFIKSDATTMIESMPYYYASDDVRNERPEKNLLARMVAHFGQVRRTFNGILKSRFNPLSSVDQYQYRYSYLSRKFFAVEAKHDWREDTQEIKFIEVT